MLIHIYYPLEEARELRDAKDILFGLRGWFEDDKEGEVEKAGVEASAGQGGEMKPFFLVDNIWMRILKEKDVEDVLESRG